MAVDTKTITSDAHIYVGDTATIQSSAHIYDTDTATITSDMYIILDIVPKKIQPTMKNAETPAQAGGTGDGGFRIF